MSEINILFQGQKLTQSKFNEIEGFVLKYFSLLWKNIRESINTLRQNNYKLLKSEVCLAFIGADSLSRFREIITTGEEKENNNENRFREWFDDFVFNDRNDIYKKYKTEIDCDSSTAWKLRNSLLHFYGLPKSKLVGFSTYNQVFIKNFKKVVSSKYSGQQVRMINPYRLIEAILDGFLTQAKTLAQMIESGDDKQKEIYAEGIVKCYEIIQNEGSVFASSEKVKND
ncbi:MAG: hypothetical protein ABIH10_01285 [Spirochaetota bacterium]